MNESTVMWLNPHKASDRDCPTEQMTIRAISEGLSFRIATTIDDLEVAIASAEILIGTEVEGRVISSAPRLRWIHVPAAGVDLIMSDEVRESSVMVTNSGHTTAQEVAEHALALTLTLMRGIDLSVRGRLRGTWVDVRAERPPRSLSGSSALVVGFGRIGQTLASHLRMLGARVTGVRRNTAGSASNGNVVPVTRLDSELPIADIVVLTLPATTESFRMFDSRRLALMKPGSILVNVGRGSVVDEDALAHALECGPLLAAASDVVATAPLKPESRLWSAENFVLTPHIGSASQNRWPKLIDCFFDNLHRYRLGAPLSGVVDKGAW